ncbi:hypothetical protein KJ951_02995 [Patescibacteria group bacterium]|nr:hypothetical protein [Patescibacteria group bacterium]MBU1703347.1 hypothetical protein [Patescibacteria group bacterium]MBU1953871.1 hypothetical protein [Patescibacteria group bacterium]
MALEDKIGQISEDSAAIAADIKFMMAGLRNISVLKGVSLEEWMRFAEEYLAPLQQPVDDKIIRKVLDQLGEIRDLRVQFPEKFKCCVTIMPCDASGRRLDDDDITNGAYLTHFLVPANSQIANDSLFRFQGLLYNFMPPEIQKNCTFEIDEYIEPPDKPYDVGSNERTKLITKYARALTNLKHYCDTFFKRS